MRSKHNEDCADDCLGHCFECDEALEQTGRNTLYCPSCDTCFECGCPRADGFAHYVGCPELEYIEASDDCD